MGAWDLDTDPSTLSRPDSRQHAQRQDVSNGGAWASARPSCASVQIHAGFTFRGMPLSRYGDGQQILCIVCHVYKWF